MNSPNERALNHRILKASALVEQIVKSEFSIRWWKPRHEDNIRLVRLLQWEEKYRVSVRWILKLLVPIWKEKYAKYQTNGIGVTIPTLIGKKSEEILVQSLQEQFPNGEHLDRWVASEKTRQWRAVQEQKKKIHWEDPREGMRAYRQMVGKEREAFRKFSQQMKRRKYRNNPWV